MQKSKLSQFKKLIAEMDEVALREELLKLYTKLPNVVLMLVAEESLPSQ